MAVKAEGVCLGGAWVRVADWLPNHQARVVPVVPEAPLGADAAVAAVTSAASAGRS